MGKKKVGKFVIGFSLFLFLFLFFMYFLPPQPACKSGSRPIFFLVK